MTGPGKPSGGFLEWLAIQGHIDNLRSWRVWSDCLTWSRFTGSLALVLLVLLCVTGVFMAFNYTPVPGTAYDSVDFAQFDLPFGDLVRGIHHYAWNLLLVVLAAHLFRALLVAAYQAPRELTWITGMILMLFIPAFIITGDLLPWDQKGYWSTQVRVSIMGSVPVVGDYLIGMLRGGPRTGIVALTRFYVLHVLVFPGVLLLLLGLHFHFLAHRGVSEPLSGNRERRQVPFFPNILNRWLLLFLATTIVLGMISHQWPAPLGDPADPTDSSFVPKPEWWVLFLNQLVAIFSGPLMVVGTAIIPGALAGGLMALPFMDRGPERRPAKRKALMAVISVIGVILLILSVMGYLEHYGHPPA